MMADGCSTFIGDLNLRRVTGGVLVFTFSIYQIGLYCVCLPNVKLILDYQIPAPCIKDLKIMGNDKHKTDKLKPMASRRNDRFPAVWTRNGLTRLPAGKVLHSQARLL